MPGAGIVLSASSTSRCEFLTYLTDSSLPYTCHCSPRLVSLEWVTISKEIAVLRRGTSGPCSSTWRSSHRTSLRRYTARAWSTGWNASWSHTIRRLAAWHRTSLSRHWATGTRLSCRVHGSGLAVRTRSRLGLTHWLRLARSRLTRTRLPTTKIKIQAWSHKSCIKRPATYP